MLYASIDTATSGDNTLVAAVAGRRIRVVGYALVAVGAVTVRWKSGASTNLSGAMSLITGVPVAAGPAPEGMGGQYGLLETASGDGLVLNLGGNVQVSGHLSYTIVN